MHTPRRGYATISYPSFIKIVEVGARDGLQNEKHVVDSKHKIELINRLSEAGLKSIEATAFVSPKWVPQVCTFPSLCRPITKISKANTPKLYRSQKDLKCTFFYRWEIAVKC